MLGPSLRIKKKMRIPPTPLGYDDGMERASEYFCKDRCNFVVHFLKELRGDFIRTKSLVKIIFEKISCADILSLGFNR